MDELQMVRDLISERPPPRPEVIAAARARLSGRTPPRRPAAPRRRPPGRHRALRVGVPVAAAVTAAAVIATVVVQGGTAPHPAANLGVYQPPPGTAGTAGGSARDTLLAVARTAAKNAAGIAAPPAGTRYWVTSSVAGNFVRVGPFSDRYVILEKTAAQYWGALNPQAMSQDYNQRLGVQLASTADRQAWRRDGSPSSWDVNQETSASDPEGYTGGGGAEIRAGLGKPYAFFGQTGGPTFVIGHRSFSASGLRELPADPAQLKALLLTGYSTVEGFASVEDYLWMSVPGVLTMPVTPQVRAGLYQLLAGLPGVRDLGSVQDAAGQSGVAVALDSHQTHCGHWNTVSSGTDHWTFTSCQVQDRLVVDPGTGQLLSEELRYLSLPPGQSWSPPGGLFSYQIFGTTKWSSANPPKN
jgi:hypothetical protein